MCVLDCIITTTPASPKLLDQVRQTMRLRHMSLITERNYTNYITEYIHFHKNRTGQFIHPRDRDAQDLRSFLANLALWMHDVTASIQDHRSPIQWLALPIQRLASLTQQPASLL